MTEINDSVGNLSARMVGTDLEVTHTLGSDLVFTAGATPNGQLTVTSSERDAAGASIPGANSVTADLAASDEVVMGGVVDFTFDEGVEMTASSVDASRRVSAHSFN